MHDISRGLHEGGSGNDHEIFLLQGDFFCIQVCVLLHTFIMYVKILNNNNII